MIEFVLNIGRLSTGEIENFDPLTTSLPEPKCESICSHSLSGVAHWEGDDHVEKEELLEASILNSLLNCHYLNPQPVNIDLQLKSIQTSIFKPAMNPTETFVLLLLLPTGPSDVERKLPSWKWGW